MRAGLRSILEKQPDMGNSGEAQNGLVALQLAKKLRPDLIIMDISMPDLNGIEATSRSLLSFPDCESWPFPCMRIGEFLIKMLKAGASGYLLKDCASEELIDAVHVIMKNRLYISLRW